MRLERCPECDARLPRGKPLHLCPLCGADWGYPGWPDICPACDRDMGGAAERCPLCDEPLAETAKEIAALRRSLQARQTRGRWLRRAAIWGVIVGVVLALRAAGVI